MYQKNNHAGAAAPDLSFASRKADRPLLTVYKASAGSGKTFRLTVEYLKLLIENPQAYRRILAVTFTNKATEEMKQRILSQLYGISHRLPDSRGYLETVMRELGVSEQMAVERSGVALGLLVHNYHNFRVDTIDSFFQSVLRNLAREMDLTANYNVALNAEQVEEQAVDEMIEDLSPESQVMNWILDYIGENIDDDKSWNVIGSIKDFGKVIFNDDYKEERKRLEAVAGDPDFFPKYTRMLRKMRHEAKQRMEERADGFFRLLEENGLEQSDLKGGKSSVGSYFRKLRGDKWSADDCCNATMRGCAEDATNWASKTSKRRDEIVSLAESTLRPYLIETEQMRETMWKQYVTTGITLRNINQLRLLGHIEERVMQNNREAGRFLLADTQTFLHRLIEGSDTPFIFEKIGAQLEHIMIDEFQDTGTVQWKNFRVLLNETMSRGSNLIVGDVKQSIYRWRGGDWQLLNNIEERFDNHPIAVKDLDTNYRSTRRVVEFNNRFFETAGWLESRRVAEVAPDEAEQVEKAYANVAQRVPEGKPDEGLVRVTLLPKKDYETAVVEQVINTVDELMGQGIRPERISILTRSNRHIQIIAEAFLQQRPDIPVVSAEAFRLDASLAVNTLINGLRALVHPSEKLYEQQLRKACTHINGTCDVAFPLDNSLLSQPLTNIVEQLFSLFSLEKLTGESAYVCAFHDEMNKFLQDMGGDVDAFLRAWDDDIHKKTTQNPQADGIQLLTIHKSKGLEFDHVIVPFCSWKINNGDKTRPLWCRPSEAPYDELPLVPVNYGSEMKDSIYAADYRHEFLQMCVDNLNLLYVAFTRAAKSLFVIGSRDDATVRSRLIQSVIEEWQGDSGGKDEPLVYEEGTLPTAADEKTKTSENPFMQVPEPVNVALRSSHATVNFKQSNSSKAFLEDADDDDAAGDDRQRYIKMGNIMHSLFSGIRTADDIPQALRELEIGGVLYDEDITAERVEHMLSRRMSHPRVADWFSPRWTLFNECSIISIGADGQLCERRPDRVMTDGKETVVVDFKFGRQREEHLRQVGEYMQLLRGMGHASVSGYLWYVYNNEIVEVR